MAEARKESKLDWYEIATAGFIIALILWLLYNSKQSPAAQQGDTNLTLPANPANNDQTPSLTIPALNIPGITLPPNTNGGGGGGGDCCCGCAAGSSSNPSISQIVANTNAAIAQMQQASQATLAAIVAEGNQSSGGLQPFELSAE